MVVPKEQNEIQPIEKTWLSWFLTRNPIFGLAAIIKKEDTLYPVPVPEWVQSIHMDDGLRRSCKNNYCPGPAF